MHIKEKPQGKDNKKKLVVWQRTPKTMERHYQYTKQRDLHTISPDEVVFPQPLVWSNATSKRNNREKITKRSQQFERGLQKQWNDIINTQNKHTYALYHQMKWYFDKYRCGGMPHQRETIVKRYQKEVSGLKEDSKRME